MRVWRAILGAVAVLFWAMAASAQEDDKGFLTRTLQDALSGAGRTVSIDGFRGALSAQAAFDRMTIADDAGVWLTLTDVVLDWNRAALLRGRLEVTQLTAAALDLPRLPQSEDQALPEAEAAPFSLPQLPVSIEIGQFGIDQIRLGAPLLGEAVALRISASARYTDTEAQVDLSAERTDGQRGVFAIAADLQRGAGLLDLSVALREGTGGIAANLLSIPGQPAIDLDVSGTGPLDNFTAQVALASDGVDRLAGEIILGADPSGSSGRRILADIGGDITPILAPRFQAFFGQDLKLRADAVVADDGAVDLRVFDLIARAARLSGRAELDAKGWPRLIDIEGQVASPEGGVVTLPIGEIGAQVAQMGLDVAYDAARGDRLEARFALDALSLDAAEVQRAMVSLNGTLREAAGGLGRFAGDVSLDATGLSFADAALAKAVGSRVSGAASIAYAQEDPLRIDRLSLSGQDYAVTGSAVIQGVETGLATAFSTQFEARDVRRFADLAGQDLSGQAALSVNGTVVPLSGAFGITVSGRTEDLAVGIPQADAVLAGRTTLRFSAQRGEEGTQVQDLALENAALRLTGSADLRSDASQAALAFELTDLAPVVPQVSGPVRVSFTGAQDPLGWQIEAVADGPFGARLRTQGRATGPQADLTFAANLPDVSNFAPEIEGSLAATGRVFQTEAGWRVESTADGPFDVRADLSGALAPRLALRFDAALPDVGAVAEGLSGPLQATGDLRQTASGFEIEASASGPFQAALDVEGPLTPELDLEIALALPDLARVVPQLPGALAAEGRVRQTGQGFEIAASATGPFAALADVSGQLTPALDLEYALRLPNLQPLVPQAPGPLMVAGQVIQRETGLFVRSDLRGPFQAQARVEGLATGPEMRLLFDLGLPNVAPFAPGIVGPLAVRGALAQGAAGLEVEANLTGPYQGRASVDGVVTGPDANVAFDLSLPDLGTVVPRINGPLNVQGSALRQGAAWQVSTDVAGPAGTTAQASGQVLQDGALDLRINGTAPLGLSRPFIAPRDLQGTAQFDLQVKGPPALSSLAGTLRTSGASLSAPNLRLAFQDIAASVRLGANRAEIEASAQGSDGGRVDARGTLGLTGPLAADLDVALDRLALVDPRLYTTAVTGGLRVSGALVGQANVVGQINLEKTVVNVPSTGLTSVGDIPVITHIGATRPVMSTRRRAGVEDTAAAAETGASRSSVLGLDVTVNAPNRIFVRGRGLDAELGGALRLTGSTSALISAGRFDLLRGRLDLLGQRFDLREGSAQFEGDFIPYVRFVTATATETGEVRVIVEGPSDGPDVRFEATPEAPQDEVLAQLLFGRSLTEISPFQALQLANAVATLAGRGGAGVIANLREGFGLDDFDVTTTSDGATAVRAGKYISENVYTDVTAASDGEAEISLNIDITDTLTGKATVGSDGNSGIGIFFERDY